MPGAFLAQDLTAGAVVTAPGVQVAASMPLSNLRDPQPRIRARFQGGVARLLFDLLGTAPVDGVALLSTTAGPAATVRVALSTVDPTGQEGDAWDTGAVPAETSAACGGNVVVVAPATRLVDVLPRLTMDTVLWTMDTVAWTMDAVRAPQAAPSAASDALALEDGSGLALVEDQSAVDPGAPDGNALLAEAALAAADAAPALVATGPPLGRYLLVELSDPSRQSIDVGLVVAGRLWRPGVAMLYGMREGRAIADRRDRNPFTGAEFAVPAVANPRRMDFTLPLLVDAATAAAHRDLLDRLGGARDALWIPEVGDGQAEANRRALWGAVNLPGDDAVVERAIFSRMNRAFRMTERL